jgi:hypothetical protein
MLTPPLLSSGSESVRDSGKPGGAQQVSRRVIDLAHDVRLEFAAVLAEGNRRPDPARAEVVPRGVEPEKDKGLSELLVLDPLPVPARGAVDVAGIILYKKIPVLEVGI